MKTLLHIVVTLALFFAAACGQFLDVGEAEEVIEAKGRRTVGAGLNAGGIHSTSPNYSFDHRLNVNPTGGVMRGPYYEIKPGY